MALSEEALATLASQAQGKALVKLIQEAIDAPQVYSVGALLSLPNLKSLPAEDQQWLWALQLFAHGTFEDLQRQPPAQRSLISDGATYKLKQLSLIDLAALSPKITYQELMSRLDIKDTRELERLLIASSYASLVQVSMNVKEQTVKLRALRSRDHNDADLAQMAERLRSWQQQCGVGVSDLQTQIERAYHSVAVRKQSESRHAQAIAEAERTAAAQAGSLSPTEGVRSKRSNPRQLEPSDDDEEDDMEPDGSRREVHRKRKSSTRWT